MESFKKILIPGLTAGVLAAGLFSLVIVSDGIGDFKLFLSYALAFSLIFFALSTALLVYGRLLKMDLTLHNQFFLISLFLLSIILFIPASYLLKTLNADPDSQKFYSFPRILTIIIPVFVFLWISKKAKRPQKILVMAITAILILSWTLITLFGGILSLQQKPLTTPNSPNVLLFTIESLRYDHLGTTSNKEIKTEVLDGLIENGVFFTNYFVQASYTTASLSTISTGCYPFHHGSRAFGQKPDPEYEFFLKKMSEEKYSTRVRMAFFEDLFNPQEGFYPKFFDRVFSFHYYVSAYLGDIFPGLFGSYAISTATAIVETGRLARAIRLNKKRKWMFWTHVSPNCHWPYKSPPQFTRLYSQEKKRSLPSFSIKDIEELNANPEKITDNIKDKLDAAYSAEVSCIDRQIGYIISKLRSLDLMTDTVVIITSDHGELLGEDGLVGHGYSLHDDLIHVPLIMYTENPSLLPQGIRIDEFVEAVDLAPTILALCGIEYDETSYDGKSILPLLKSGAWQKESVYSEFVLDEGNQFFACFKTRGFKLVWNATENSFSLFDHRKGMDEKNDLSHENPQVLEEMKKDMLDLAGMPTFTDLKPKKISKLDKETEEQMRALGYIK